MKNKAELEKLQQERDALKKQNEELLEKYEKAQGSEKKKIGTQLETNYDQAKIFDEAMQEIQRGAYTKVIQTVGPIVDDRDAAGNPLAYAHYLRGRAYYGLNRMSEALDDFNAAERTPHDDTYPVWRSKQYRGLIGARSSIAASSITTGSATTKPSKNSKRPMPRAAGKMKPSATTSSKPAGRRTKRNSQNSRSHPSPRRTNAAAMVEMAAASTGQKSSPTSLFTP